MLLRLLPEATPEYTAEKGPGLWIGGLGRGEDTNREADAVLSWADYITLCDTIRDLLPTELADAFDFVVANERTAYHDELQAMHDTSAGVVSETTALLGAMGS